jgi:hexulose-6-phosphate isomerase
MMPPFANPEASSARSINRREVIASTWAATTILAAAGGQPLATGASPQSSAGSLQSSPKTYRMKKSINLWAFPYPGRMSLRDSLELAKNAGFDGIELNYDLESDLSPKATAAELQAIRKTAHELGIAISGLCSFLYWPYSLTDNDSTRRARSLELASLMVRAAHEIGTENLLTIAGSTYIPWLPDREPVPIDVCARRARESIGKLVPVAEKLGVNLNIENIVFNGYLTTPDEMNAFVDSFSSERVGVHFDTGNVMLF